MDIDKLRQVLAWSTVLHYSLVTVWFIAYSRHRGWYRRLIGRHFALSEAELEGRIFLLIGCYKIGIVLFFLIPSIALRIAS